MATMALFTRTVINTMLFLSDRMDTMEHTTTSSNQRISSDQQQQQQLQQIDSFYRERKRQRVEYAQKIMTQMESEAAILERKS